MVWTLLSKLSIPLQAHKQKKSPQRAQLGRGASIAAGTTNRCLCVRELRYPGCQEEKRVPEENRNTGRARETVIQLSLSGTGSREERNHLFGIHSSASIRRFAYENSPTLTSVKGIFSPPFSSPLRPSLSIGIFPNQR